VQSKEFRPGVSSFAVATSTTKSHMEVGHAGIPGYWQYGVSKVDVDAISLLACQCKTQQRILALTYYVGTRDIDREI
jgi:hypothetical protein